MENLLILGQATLQVIKNFIVVIPLLIIFSLYVNQLNKEEEQNARNKRNS